MMSDRRSIRDPRPETPYAVPLADCPRLVGDLSGVVFVAQRDS